MRRVLTLALATTAALIATPASASLVYNTGNQILISSQGFGNAPRSLTVQATGNSQNPPASESGCISVSGGTLTKGTSSCMTSGQAAALTPPSPDTFYANAGGNEPNPAGFPKQGDPTVASLGWVTAADIGILFNSTQPAGSGVALADLTLKFLDSSGNVIGYINGSHTFSATEVGNGSAGFLFTVDPAEYTYVATILGSSGTIYTALEATINGTAGGEESFRTINLHTTYAVPEPATWAMMLLGFGGIGMAMRRRRASTRLLQIA